MPDTVTSFVSGGVRYLVTANEGDFRPDDADRARALIDAFEHAPSGPDRGCAVCGEISPGSFEVCWHCGHTL